MSTHLLALCCEITLLSEGTIDRTDMVLKDKENCLFYKSQGRELLRRGTRDDETGRAWKRVDKIKNKGRREEDNVSVRIEDLPSVKTPAFVL